MGKHFTLASFIEYHIFFLIAYQGILMISQVIIYWNQSNPLNYSVPLSLQLSLSAAKSLFLLSTRLFSTAFNILKYSHFKKNFLWNSPALKLQHHFSTLFCTERFLYLMSPTSNLCLEVHRLILSLFLFILLVAVGMMDHSLFFKQIPGHLFIVNLLRYSHEPK